jgi:5'-phosphate synthase pdxT subunit
MTPITVGVLALQGAFHEHILLLRSAASLLSPAKPPSHPPPPIDWTFPEVRTPSDLAKCDALIIPGGESTTMSLVAARSGLLEPLRQFVK